MYHILFLLLLILPAQAHDSWISRQHLTDPVSGEWCCNRIDCAPTSVKEVSGGYMIADTGEVVARQRVIWRSPDGTWVRCRFLSGPKKDMTRCLIGPPPNS